MSVKISNKPQYLIVWNLAKSHSNLFVVRVMLKSIYRWRGAEIKNILNFAKDFSYDQNGTTRAKLSFKLYHP